MGTGMCTPPKGKAPMWKGAWSRAGITLSSWLGNDPLTRGLAGILATYGYQGYHKYYQGYQDYQDDQDAYLVK